MHSSAVFNQNLFSTIAQLWEPLATAKTVSIQRSPAYAHLAGCSSQSSWSQDATGKTQKAYHASIIPVCCGANCQFIVKLLTPEVDPYKEVEWTARMAANGIGPRLVDVFDVHADNKSAVAIVLERMSKTLEEHVKAGNVVSTSMQQEIMDMLLSMWTKTGHVIIDPHPGNIMFDSAGKLRLIDWGLVHKKDESRMKAFLFADMPMEILTDSLEPKDYAKGGIWRWLMDTQNDLLQRHGVAKCYEWAETLPLQHLTVPSSYKAFTKRKRSR